MTLFNKSACTLAFVCVGAQTLVASLVSSMPSMKEYATESAKLNVYSDVPGHEKSVIKGYASRSKSDIYEIRVRSAATGNEWVQCFANTGSAPFYLDWPVAVGLLDPATAKPIWSAPLGGVDIRKWRYWSLHEGSDNVKKHVLTEGGRIIRVTGDFGKGTFDLTLPQLKRLD